MSGLDAPLRNGLTPSGTAVAAIVGQVKARRTALQRRNMKVKNVPKVLIRVEGGAVQAVLADRPVDVWLVDWDEADYGGQVGIKHAVDIDKNLIAAEHGRIILRASEA
jgi:hypothetical protein